MIVRYTGPDIIDLRKRNGWTQRELALALCDVPPDQWDRLKEAMSTVEVVRKWEQGETRPAGPALKLLNVIADKGLQAIL